MRIRELVGVYDADGGIRGELSYITGKLLGQRHCDLCDITHSPIRRRRSWADYVASLPVPFRVVHRNERTLREADATSGREPCVAVALTDESIEVLLSAEDLSSITDVAALGRAITSALTARGLSLAQ